MPVRPLHHIMKIQTPSLGGSTNILWKLAQVSVIQIENFVTISYQEEAATPYRVNQVFCTKPQ